LPAVRTARSKSRSSHSERVCGGSAHHASCAACPACAIALPAVMGSPGFSQRTGVAPAGSSGGRGSSKSVPDTCSLASSAGHSSTGTGGYTRISADPCATVIPGSALALSQAAPRARLTTFLMRASSHALAAAAHSPSGSVTRGSDRKRSTARAAPSSASVLAGGVPRSTRMTSGSAYCGPSSLVASCILAGVSADVPSSSVTRQACQPPPPV
jgi:hypothetical protein